MPRVIILPLELYGRAKEDIYTLFLETLTEAGVSEIEVFLQCIPLLVTPINFEDWIRGPSLPELYEQLCKGDWSLPEWFELLKQRMPSLNIEVFKRAWAKKRGLSELLRQAFDEVRDLTAKFKDIEVFWLGNTSPLDINIIEEDYKADIPGNTFFSFDKKALRKNLLDKLLVHIKQKYPHIERERIAYFYNAIGVMPFHQYGVLADLITALISPRKYWMYRQEQSAFKILEQEAEKSFRLVSYSRREGVPNIGKKLEELQWKEPPPSPRRSSTTPRHHSRSRSPTPPGSRRGSFDNSPNTSRPVTPESQGGEGTSATKVATSVPMGILPALPNPGFLQELEEKLDALPPQTSPFKEPPQVTNRLSSSAGSDKNDRSGSGTSRRCLSFEETRLPLNQTPVSETELELSASAARELSPSSQLETPLSTLDSTPRGSLEEEGIGQILSECLEPPFLNFSGSPFPLAESAYISPSPSPITALSEGRRGSTAGLLPSNIPQIPFRSLAMEWPPVEFQGGSPLRTAASQDEQARQSPVLPQFQKFSEKKSPQGAASAFGPYLPAREKELSTPSKKNPLVKRKPTK